MGTGSDSCSKGIDLRILVIEDDSLLVDLYKDWLPIVLGEYDFPGQVLIDFTYSGMEAARALSEKDYDITFLDDVLPACSGKDLYSCYSERMGEVIITSSEVHTFMQDLRTSGDVHCLSKPFGCSELKDIISTLLIGGKCHVNCTAASESKEYKAVN